MRSVPTVLMLAMLTGLAAGCSKSAPTDPGANGGSDKKSPAEEKAAALFAQYQQLSERDKHGAKGHELMGEIEFLLAHISVESRQKIESSVEAHKKKNVRDRNDRPPVYEYDPETGIEMLPQPRVKE